MNLRTSFLPLFVLFLLAASLQAQDKSLKLYSNFHWSPQAIFSNNVSVSEDFAGLSAAYQWQRAGGWVHEVEAAFDPQKTDHRFARTSGFTTHLRYETGRYLPGKLFNTLRVRWGVSALTGYTRMQGDVFPDQATPATISSDELSFQLDGILHLEWNITDRWHLDLNSSLISLGVSRSSREATTTAGVLESRDNWNTYLPCANNAALRLRLGVGYRF